MRGVFAFLAAGFLIAGASAILVWPLWKLATSDRILYAILVGGAILVFLLWRLGRRFLLRRFPRGGAKGSEARA